MEGSFSEENQEFLLEFWWMKNEQTEGADDNNRYLE